jgi:hypothetical protein
VNIGDLVKPLRGGPWRLGVVERIDDARRLHVRAYVAPPASYAGTIAAYRASELAVVPLESVVAALTTARARESASSALATQIAEAIDAAQRLR